MDAALGGDRRLPVRPSRPREEVFSIDTPPPTVSGSLHVGHVFSFTHTDLVARFQRMRGKAVFYPMGWDDNGLPTERRVQNYYGVRCDPSLPYDPAFTPPAQPAKPPISVSRPNFIELCDRLTRRRREGLRAAVEVPRPVGRLVDDLRDDRQARAARLAAGVPAPAAARPGLPGRSADAVGRRLQDRRRAGRARRSRDAGRVSPHPVRASARRVGARRDRNDPSRADSGVRRARRASRRRAIPAAVRHRGRDAAVRRARAGQGARARRSRKGQRHRDDLHVRRHHRRHLVARAQPAGARDHPGRRHAACR